MGYKISESGKSEARQIIEEILNKECCLMCQNFCDTYCASLHRAISENDARGKPCEADGNESRFEALLSEYQVEAIENAFLKQQEPEPDVEVEIAQKVGKIRERFSSKSTVNT